MQITPLMKMANVIQMNHMLIPVMQRFGINLGFGDKTVEEVCKFYDVDLSFFLNLTNAYHDKEYFPTQELQNIPVHSIVNYLKKTHSCYLTEKLIDIESLIHLLENEKSDDKKHITLIKNFFDGYRNELREHIMREEDVVFPYILTISKVIREQKITSDSKKILDSYSMDTFLSEHDDIEEKLFDLKTIMIRYLTPPRNVNIYNKIVQELFMLEEDLNYHSRIEEKVLIPKVEYMERVVKKLL